jgi:peptidyl-prolyl cis-trans isomerase SurA
MMPEYVMPSLRLARAALSTALLVVAVIATPAIAQAQVVALVNGAPITDLDIAQRTRLDQVTTGKSLGRKQVLEELIEDHLKIFIAKRYGLDISDSDVDQALNSMAERSHITRQQLEQSLTGRGVSPSALRFKIQAEIGWGQLVRGRYSASLQINDADIRNAMKAGDNPGKDPEANIGYTYTMYPIVLIAPRGEAGSRMREAENLRSRFDSCAQGVKMVRVMRGAVVREPIVKDSADLAPALRDMLDKMEIGKLTTPEVTAQGIQMFALCDRRKNTTDTPAKRAIREQLYAKRYEAESRKFMNEVRRQAMIVYK